MAAPAELPPDAPPSPTRVAASAHSTAAAKEAATSAATAEATVGAAVSSDDGWPASDGERAFEAGDWRRARDLARKDLAAPEPTRSAAARSLLSRLALDPQLVALFALAVVTLVATAWGYLRH